MTNYVMVAKQFNGNYSALLTPLLLKERNHRGKFGKHRKSGMSELRLAFDTEIRKSSTLMTFHSELTHELYVSEKRPLNHL